MADEDWAAKVDEQERQISGQVSEGFDQKWAEMLRKRIPHRSLLHYAYGPLFQENNSDNNSTSFGTEAIQFFQFYYFYTVYREETT